VSEGPADRKKREEKRRKIWQFEKNVVTLQPISEKTVPSEVLFYN
jgi:hypothetical protein